MTVLITVHSYVNTSSSGLSISTGQARGRCYRFHLLRSSIHLMGPRRWAFFFFCLNICPLDSGLDSIGLLEISQDTFIPAGPEIPWKQPARWPYCVWFFFKPTFVAFSYASFIRFIGYLRCVFIVLSEVNKDHGLAPL